MPFRRRAAAPIDPNAPPPLFNGQNLARALVTAMLSGGALAATLYAPRWPIPCAIIALVIVAFASQMNIALVNPSMIVPQVRIVSTLPIREAAPFAHQEVITTGPETVVTVAPPDAPRPEQSSDSVAAAVQQRTPTGRFAPRVIPPTAPTQP